MKVVELLTLPALTGMHVIAGGSKDGTGSQTVNIGKISDIINFLNQMNSL